ncbi:MAG: hypothetical protein HYY76_09895 [Acidobacteria bacterium]|nr:hypothetical protein [Acidobacteriota bacterium]
MEADVRDSGWCDFVGEFQFLSIEHEDVTQHPTIGQANVDALITHPGFG